MPERSGGRKEGTMILVRHTFQAKYGHGNQLVALMLEMGESLRADARMHNPRVLTDLSGPFFTVVSEYEMESLAAWEQAMGEVFQDKRFGEWFARMQPLVETGRREFFTIRS
jgi:hypothetical protein